MDRDKRHSKEAEDELDKKIALIREKNQVIAERTKEIEADRAQSIDEEPKKSPKPSSEKPATPPKSSPNNGGSRGKKEQWDREWDKGKQPVEKWRENVPSMEIAGKLAGRGGRANQNHQQKPKQENQPKGSRLEGRVSGAPVEGGAVRGTSSSRGRPGNKGRGGHQRNQKSRSVEKVGGDLKISISSIETGENKKTHRHRNQPRQKRESQGTQGSTGGIQEEKTEKKRASRPRRENDKYVVKTIVGRLVNRVVQIEKREKNRTERDEKQNTIDENSKPENEPTSEKSEEINKPAVEVAQKEAEVAKEVPKEDEKDPVAAPADPQIDQKSTAAEPSATPDANQNIIVLEKEKVATIQMSTA